MGTLIKKKKTILERWDKVNHDDIDEIISFLKRESDRIKKEYGNDIRFIPQHICDECVDFTYVFFEMLNIRNQYRSANFGEQLCDKIDYVFLEDGQESGVPFVIDVGSSCDVDVSEDEEADLQIVQSLKREIKIESGNVKKQIRNYVHMITQHRVFIYYDGKNVYSVAIPAGKQNKDFCDLVDRFVDDGGVAVLRYINPLYDGSVIVNGFISSGGTVERLPAKKLKHLMEKFEPEERKEYYRYRLAFIHLPVKS